MHRKTVKSYVVNGQIFFDPSGKRFRHVIATGGALLSTLVMALFGIIWLAIGPLWTVPINQHNSFPRELLESADTKTLPVVGEGEQAALTRIALVTRRQNSIYLTDPFTNRVLRPVKEEELEVIGSSPLVMDRFGIPGDHQLMLTFDDGPHPLYTPEILDLLSREKIPSTFFTIGENIITAPDIFRRLVREGHMVGNHTWDHADFGLDDFKNREELITTDHVMRSAHYESRLWRIPRGNPEGKPLAVLQGQQLGYLQVDFDLDTLDWQYPSNQDIPTPQLDGRGHVVLLHDGGGDRRGTIEMLQRLIDEAKKKGYTFTTLAPLLPDNYMPVKAVTPSLTDRSTFFIIWVLTIFPKHLLFSLTVFAVITLTFFTLLHVVLASIHRRRQVRKNWPSSTTAPWVSVVIAAFNEEKVIAKTLDYLRKSTHPILEVIVIDDGSTDTTHQILENYAREWPRLRVVQQANQGKSVALNKGVSMARSTVVVLLDADTVFEKQTIEILARHFVDPRVGAVAGHVKVGNRCNILTWWQSLEYISGICVTRMAEAFMGAITIVPGACSAWRREIILNAGGFCHDTLAEDAELTLRCQKLGYKVIQDNSAIAWTEAPETIRSLAKQRRRWTYGNLQAFWKHRDMLFRPKYGILGMVILPHSVLSIVVPLAFMPFMILALIISLMHGNWQSVALFGLFVGGMHLLVSVVALIMVRESPWHLLIVPIYRLIYEPLRVYLLYASLFVAIRGRTEGWNKLTRTNSVTILTPSVPHAVGTP